MSFAVYMVNVSTGMAFFLSIPSLLSPLLPTSLLAQVAEAAEVTNAQLGPLVLGGGATQLGNYLPSLQTSWRTLRSR